MRSWPVRTKLIAIPMMAAALVTVTAMGLEGASPRYRLVIGAGALAAGLALAACAWAITHSLTRRIGALREVLSHLQDRDPPPRNDGDEIERLSESLRKAIYRSQEREAQMRHSSEFLQFAQAASGFGIFDLDLVTEQIAGTPLFFELIGLPSRPLAFPRHDWLATIHPEDFEAVVRELNAAISAGGTFQAEYRSLMLDGGVR